MSDALTFDIVAELSSYDVASEDVTVFGDEKAAYELQQIIQAGGERKEGSPVPKTLQAKLDKAKKKVAESQYTFRIKGILPEDKKLLLEQAYNQYKRTYTPYGMVEQKEERDEYYTDLIWSEQVVSIRRADGATVPELNVEVISSVRGSLPKRSAEVINQAMIRIANETAAALDFMMADADFLSQPSPEA